MLDAVAAYDDSDTMDDLLQIPGIPMIVRGNLYDALRIRASDGPVSPEELKDIQRMVEPAGVPPEVVTEIYEIIVAEQVLRDRRYELITKPIFMSEQS